MPRTQAEIINIAKTTRIGFHHTLYEFCWSNVAKKCVEATDKQVENLIHLERDLIRPIEEHFGLVIITQGIRDDEIYRLLFAKHQKQPNIWAKPSATSHHFTGNAVDFKHTDLEEIFEWVIEQGLPTRELRLYNSHLHIAQMPSDMKRIKDCR